MWALDDPLDESSPKMCDDFANKWLRNRGIPFLTLYSSNCLAYFLVVNQFEHFEPVKTYFDYN